MDIDEFFEKKQKEEGIARATQSLAVVSEKNPDQVAEDMQIAKETGFDLSFVERNRDELKKRKKERNVDDFLRDNGYANEWLADPQNAGLVSDDPSMIGSIKRYMTEFPEALGYGAKDVRANELSLKFLYNKMSPEENVELQMLERQLHGKSFTSGSALRQYTVGAAFTAPQIADQAVAAEQGTAAGGLVGAGVGTLFPGIGTAAGALSGASKGAMVATGLKNFEQQSGMIIRDLRSVRNEQGQALDDNVIRGAAVVAGATSGLLEYTPLRKILKTIPGAEKIADLIGKEGIKKAIRTPGTQEVLYKVYKAWVEAGLSEGVVETAQQGVQIAAGETAKSLSEAEFKPITFSEATEQLYEAGKGGFFIGLGLGTPGSVASAGIGTYRSRNITPEQVSAHAQRINRAVRADKLFQRSPEKFHSLVTQLAGADEKFYVTSDAAKQAIDSLPEEQRTALFNAVPDLAKELEEADLTGHVAITKADYATYIAPYPQADTLTQHIKLDPADKSLFERTQEEEFMKANPELFQKMFGEAYGDRPVTSREMIPTIKRAVSKALQAVGRKRDEAEAIATLYGKMLSNFAALFGMNAIDRLNQSVLEFNALDEDGNPVARKSNIDVMFDDIEKIKAGKPVPGLDEQGRGAVRVFADRLEKAGISLEKAREMGSRAVQEALFPVGAEEGIIDQEGVQTLLNQPFETPGVEMSGVPGQINIGLSASTDSISGLKILTEQANSGDITAHVALQQIASNMLRRLTSGLGSVKIKEDRNTGLYGGALEPSLGITVDFDEAERSAVLAALAQFAQNFNQQQVHVRQPSDGQVGEVNPDGSFNTPVAVVGLSRPLSRQEIESIIQQSGLPGVTFNDNKVEMYYVGEPTNTDDIARWKAGAKIAYEAVKSIGASDGGFETGSDRLWIYGDGSGAIPYEQIAGDVRTEKPGADPNSRLVAERYFGSEVKPVQQAKYQKGKYDGVADEQAALQRRIAAEYELIPDNDMDNPIVRQAYEALAKEVIEQYRALIIKTPIPLVERDASGKIVRDENGDPVTKGEPYKKTDKESASDAMRRDVQDKNSMTFFPTTRNSFGPAGVDFSGHPLLNETEFSDGHPVEPYRFVVNDLFRVVHDYYAHSMSPTSFGALGEEAAWKNHMATIKSPLARWALTTETRGQNSWVNFNKDQYGKYAPKDARPFARQKAALLPIEYTLTGDAAVDAPVSELIAQLPADQHNGSLTQRVPEEEFTVPQKLFQKGGEYGIKGFYSKMYRHLADKLNATGTPTQFKQQIDAAVKAGHFKQDEYFWSGLGEYLDGFKDKNKKLSKEDVLAWLDKNKLSVKETVYSLEKQTVKVPLVRKGDGFPREDYPTEDDIEWSSVEQMYYTDDDLNHHLEWLMDEFKGEEDPEDWYKAGNDDDLVIASNLDDNDEPTDATTYTWDDDKINERNDDLAREYAQNDADYTFTAEVGGYEYTVYYNDERDTASIRRRYNGQDTWLDDPTGRVNEENLRQMIMNDMIDQGILYTEDMVNEMEDEFNEEQERKLEEAARRAKETPEGQTVTEEEAVALLTQGEKGVRVVSDYEDVKFYTEFDIPYLKNLMAQGAFAERQIIPFDNKPTPLTVDIDTAQSAFEKGYKVFIIFNDEDGNELPKQLAGSGDFKSPSIIKSVDDGSSRFVIVPKHAEVEGVDFKYEERWTGDLNWKKYQEGGEIGNQYEVVIQLPDIEDKGVSQHSWRGRPENIMMHLRFNERKDKNGDKTLFVEELQSDWHQQGSERGYQAQEGDRLWKITDRDGNAWADVKGKSAREAIENFEKQIIPTMGEYKEGLEKKALDGDIFAEEADENLVAQAPFNALNKYTELGMKRVLLWAVNNGYDRVAWTTGEQQSERWSGILQQEVRKIYVANKDAETVSIGVYNGRGTNVSQFIADNVKGGKFNEIPGDNSFATIPRSEATTIFGKSITDSIDATEVGGTIEGQNIKVNSKGMIEVYNKVMANIANNLVKKYDSKVEVTEIDTGQSQPTPQLSFKITDKLRESVSGGMPLFQQERGYIEFEERLRRVIVAFTKRANRSTSLHEFSHFAVATHRDFVSLARERVAMGDDTPEIRRIIEDWEKLKNAVGAKGDRFTVDQEEKIAKWFEAYAMTGKAPSEDLHRIFGMFRTWLVQIYKTIDALLGTDELNDDVKGVFDRWLATEEEISKVQEKNSSLAEIAVNLGLPADISDRVANYVNAATNKAEEDVYRELTAEQKRRETDAYKAELEAMRETVAKEFEERREYNLMKYMRDNDMKFMDGYGMEGVPDFLIAEEGGVPADDIADMYGYATGDDMLRALKAIPDFERAVITEARKRLMKKYPDMIADGRIKNVAKTAIMNDKVVIALDLMINELGKSVGGASAVSMKQFAKAIAQSRVKDMKAKDTSYAYRYEVARDKSMRDALKASRSGDPQKAMIELQKALVNQMIFKSLEDFNEFKKKAEELYYKVNRKDKDVAPGRDIDFVGAARYILAKFGMGKEDPRFKVKEWLADLQEREPDIAQDITQLANLIDIDEKPFEELTVAEYKEIFDAVENIYHVARNVKEIEVAGRKMKIEAAVADVTKDINIDNIPLMSSTQLIGKNKFKQHLSTLKASMRRVEQWTKAMGEPMWKTVYRPVNDAVDKYIDERNKWMKKLRETLKPYDARLSERRKINTGMFKTDRFGRSEELVFNDAMEMIGFLLHTGNESNLNKLLGGYGIEEGLFRQQIKQLEQKGIIKKEDWELVQKLWNLAEGLKPISQKAHKNLYGYRFDEIEAMPVVSTHGTFPGGYWPAIVDPNQTTEAKTLEQMMEDARKYMLASVPKGFTKGRVDNYRQPLRTDLRLASEHIDKVLKFSYIEPAIRNVARIVNHKDFKAKIEAVDPSAHTEMLQPWLMRSALQATSPMAMDRASKIGNASIRHMSSSSSIQLMGYNIVVAVQNFANIPVVVNRVGMRSFARGFAKALTSPIDTRRDMINSSTQMADRLSISEVRIAQELTQISARSGRAKKTADLTVRHSRVFMLAVDNIISTVAWTAAYDDAQRKGMNHTDSVSFADMVIRDSMGSNNAKDISRLEASSPLVKALMPFYSYFGAQANLVTTEFGNIMRKHGWSGTPKMFMAYVSLVAAPAILGQFIADGLRNRLPDDDDDDGEVLDDWIAWMIKAQLKYMTAAIPFFGQAANAVINRFNKNPMDDRLSISPIVSAIETTIRGASNLINDRDTDDSRLIMDVGAGIGVLTGLPLGQPVKPLAFAADINEGESDPDGGFDYVRGIITGASQQK